MIQITIDTSNAAFEDGGAEVARILRKLANDMERFQLSYDRWVLHDINGNRTGECVIDFSAEGRDTTSEDGEEE